MTRNTQKKLFAYAMASGAVAGGISQMNAQVVHTELNPDTVFTNGSYDIDFNNDTIIDLTIKHNSTTTTYYTFGRTYTYTYKKITLEMPSSNQFSGSCTASKSYCYPFMRDSGLQIGPSGTWEPANNQAALMWYWPKYSYTISGDWEKNTSGKFLGIRFNAADGIHYGWVRLSIGNKTNNLQLTIHDYAYESVINTSILTGDTGGVTLVDRDKEAKGFNIYSYDNRIFINSKNSKPFDVDIINPLGQFIKTLKLSGDDSNVEITIMDGSGIYIVKIRDDQDSIFMKKVSIR